MQRFKQPLALMTILLLGLSLSACVTALSAAEAETVSQRAREAEAARYTGLAEFYTEISSNLANPSYKTKLKRQIQRSGLV